MRTSTRRCLGALALGLSLATTSCTHASEAANTPDQSAPAPSAKSATSAKKADSVAALVPPEIRSRGTITFAMDASYPPFEYLDDDSTTIVGFDADLATALARTMGLRAKHVNAGFDTILPGLSAHKYDAGISAFGETPDRARSVDFVTYLSGGSGIMVRKGNPAGIRMDPARLCGKKISAQKGSIQGIDYLPKFSADCTKSGKKAIGIQLYPSQNEANLSVSSGRADGVMADSPPLRFQAKVSNGQFELAPGKDYEPVPFGVALSKKSELTPAMQAAMNELRRTSVYQELLDKWCLGKHGISGSGDRTAAN